MLKMIGKAMTMLLTLLTLWVAGYVVFVASVVYMPKSQDDGVTDAIVVLTGGEGRVETGFNLFSEGKAGTLIITGVHPDATEQDLMRGWKGTKPLPACCVILGYQATTTTQNAQETREIMTGKNFQSIRLVTSDFHMQRALAEFHYALPDIRIIPHPITQADATPDKEWFWILSFIEYHKTVLRWLVLLFAPTTPVNGGLL